MKMAAVGWAAMLSQLASARDKAQGLATFGFPPVLAPGDATNVLLQELLYFLFQSRQLNGPAHHFTVLVHQEHGR